MIYFNIYFHFSGLSANELLNLAKRSECAVKVSRRDLPAVLSQVSHSRTVYASVFVFGL